jgi:hypothetical protein
VRVNSRFHGKVLSQEISHFSINPILAENNSSSLLFSLVPFDEEDKDKDVWFFDHEYLENMYAMFRKVNGKQCAVREV